MLNRELNYSQYFANRILTKSLPPRMYSLKNKNKKNLTAIRKVNSTLIELILTFKNIDTLPVSSIS